MKNSEPTSNSAASTGRIAVKLDMQRLCEKLTRGSNFGYNRLKFFNTAHENCFRQIFIGKFSVFQDAKME
jgi:hypothetical protein